MLPSSPPTPLWEAGGLRGGSETGSALAVSHLSVKAFSQKFQCGSLEEGAEDSSDAPSPRPPGCPHAARMYRKETEREQTPAKRDPIETSSSLCSHILKQPQPPLLQPSGQQVQPRGVHQQTQRERVAGTRQRKQGKPMLHPPPTPLLCATSSCTSNKDHILHRQPAQKLSLTSHHLISSFSLTC